ncbi:hypothetical protein BT96DRAFT_912813 [Gymnopus androsaceus JB14]|uniref:Uncharacterized protein n=1 Tax=Gymnopus androsaceus JB14 TaxID=1447944 RepID=A0A6A4IGT5_9AGAR|nr:hypothetical protein BT96DRAFT_912813 [Gymnopus androsaceus JB14]
MMSNSVREKDTDAHISSSKLIRRPFSFTHDHTCTSPSSLSSNSPQNNCKSTPLAPSYVPVLALRP